MIGTLSGGVFYWGINQKSNPLLSADAKGLSNPSEVETLREKVYATLEAYTKQKYPEQPGRWENDERMAMLTAAQLLLIPIDWAPPMLQAYPHWLSASCAAGARRPTVLTSTQ